MVSMMVVVVVMVAVTAVVMVALSVGNDLLVVVVVRPGLALEAHFCDRPSWGRRGDWLFLGREKIWAVSMFAYTNV